MNKRIQWECNELRLAGNNSLLDLGDFCSDVIESEEEIVPPRARGRNNLKTRVGDEVNEEVEARAGNILGVNLQAS